MKKKKIIIIFLVILMSIIIISLISLCVLIRRNLTIKGIILECYKNSILVCEEKKDRYIYIGLPENINLAFEPGQEVLIYIRNNTLIQLTSPASINSQFIKNIKILKEDANPQIVEEYKFQKRKRLLEFEKSQKQLQ